MFVCLKQTMNSTADNKLCSKEDNVLPTSDCGATANGFTVEQQEGVSLWSNRKGFHCRAIGMDFTVEQQEGISLWSNSKGFTVEQQEGVSLSSNRKGFHCGATGRGFIVD